MIEYAAFLDRVDMLALEDVLAVYTDEKWNPQPGDLLHLYSLNEIPGVQFTVTVLSSRPSGWSKNNTLLDIQCDKMDELRKRLTYYTSEA